MSKFINAALFFSRLCREAGPETDLTVVHQVLEDTPALDLEKVVRCKDCKWVAKRYDGVLTCSQTQLFCFPQSYCWFGVNKEEE